jgi:predicted ATPase
MDASAVDAGRTGGSPLLATELGRLARERPGAALPAELPGVVAARLAGLDEEQRRALTAGAVVGRSFWAGAVGAVAGVGVQDACRVLDQLVGRELLDGARVSSVAREAEYAFLHSSVREAVYAQADPGERAAAHGAVADWLDVALGGRPDHDVLAEYHRTAAA